MTHQQFGWWMEENGYLDRVAKWEMNQVRLIGNKAVHENFISKEDAWNQYNYLEDILKLVSEKHPVGGKRKGGAEPQDGAGPQGAGGGRREKGPEKKWKRGPGPERKKGRDRGKAWEREKVWK